MRIVGFNYIKVSAERVVEWKPLKKINTNIEFLKVTKDEVKSMENVEVLRVHFKFGVNYEPENATIALEGFIFVSADAETTKETIKQWEKKKETQVFVFLN